MKEAFEIIPKRDYRALGHAIAHLHPMTPRGYRFKSADTCQIVIGKGTSIKAGGRVWHTGTYIAHYPNAHLRP